MENRNDIITNDTNSIITMDIDTSQIPSIIQDQFIGLSILKNNITIATDKAEKAKNSANSAKEKSAGLFHKKEAIESLQETAVDLSEAAIASTQAQEILFLYQKKLAEVTKYLFALGVSDIAKNRTVVRELELKLKGASGDELDEFARNEVLNVIKQLKAQEDTIKKLNDLNDKVKANDKLLKNHSEKEKEYDVLMASAVKKNNDQDKEIARLAVADVELMNKIVACEKENDNLNNQIDQQKNRIEALNEIVDKYEMQISIITAEMKTKESKSFCIISIGISIVALVVSVLQFIF